jgi:hypothetical protein
LNGVPLNRHFQQCITQRLAVRVERQRRGHAAAQRTLAGELQCPQVWQFAAPDGAVHDALQVLGDRIDVSPLSPVRQCTSSCSLGIARPILSVTLEGTRSRSISIKHPCSSHCVASCFVESFCSLFTDLFSYHSGQG